MNLSEMSEAYKGGPWTISFAVHIHMLTSRGHMHGCCAVVCWLEEIKN